MSYTEEDDKADIKFAEAIRDISREAHFLIGTKVSATFQDDDSKLSAHGTILIKIIGAYRCLLKDRGLNRKEAHSVMESIFVTSELECEEAMKNN